MKLSNINVDKKIVIEELKLETKKRRKIRKNVEQK